MSPMRADERRRAAAINLSFDENQIHSRRAVLRAIAALLRLFDAAATRALVAHLIERLIFHASLASRNIAQATGGTGNVHLWSQ
ncbi:hypothetical protein [Methylocapsa aurea]|uniref:hypothetical protein n=1 Tax=Methylocapsa aurea TaxID=663610 RepID=UPI003D18DD42